METSVGAKIYVFSMSELGFEVLLTFVNLNKNVVMLTVDVVDKVDT